MFKIACRRQQWLAKSIGNDRHNFWNRKDLVPVVYDLTRVIKREKKSFLKIATS